MFIQSDGKKVLLKEQILYVCENVFCTVFANQRSRRGLVRPKCLTVTVQNCNRWRHSYIWGTVSGLWTNMFGRRSVKMVWLPQICCIALTQVPTWHDMKVQQFSQLYCNLSSCLCVDTSHLHQLGREEVGEQRVENITWCLYIPL